MANANVAHTKVLSDACDLLAELDARLLSVRHLARAYADIAGFRPSGTVGVDAEALSCTMGFFADELTTARASLANAYRLVCGMHTQD